MATVGMLRVMSFIRGSNFPLFAIPFIRSPKVLRGLAANARARSDWATDAFYRRKICAIQSERGGNWLQFGHSLKELGLYGQAEQAYLRARSKGTDAAECSLQLAHLAKIQGRFEDAISYFKEALREGHSSPDHIEAELGLLDLIDNSVIHAIKIVGLIDDEPHIFLSAPVPTVADAGRADRPTGMGRADYSYAFAMRGFIRALDDMGRSYTILKNPEFISDIREQSNASINIHLGFYPAERLRLLKGAYNINCFAWEFDRLRLPSETLSYHAFADQTEMLDLADEVWAPSSHGARALARTVRKPVHMVAAPILGDLRPMPREAPPEAGRIRSLASRLAIISWQPLAIFSRVQAAMNEAAAKRESCLFEILKRRQTDRDPLIFITILNVHDWRKQIYPLLEGFIQVRKSHPEAILLVKATTPFPERHSIHSHLLGEQVEDAGALPRPLVSDNIWVTDQVFSRDEMNALFDLAAFYLCTSYAEGQNLPLLEAMGRGVVPVSVDHTAMADYVSAETGIPIRSEIREFGPRLSARYGLFGLQTHFVVAVDVQKAVESAAGQSRKGYAALSAASLEIVKDKYGVMPLTRALDRVICAMRSSAKDA